MRLDSSKRLGCSESEQSAILEELTTTGRERPRLVRALPAKFAVQLGEDFDAESRIRGGSRGSSPHRLSRDTGCRATTPERHLHRGWARVPSAWWWESVARTRRQRPCSPRRPGTA